MLRHFGFHAALLGGAFALTAWVGSARAQNILTNPDMDNTSVSTQVLATPTNWVAAASKTISGPFNDGMSSEGFANVQQPGGFGLFFKPFQGNAQTGDKISASISQDNPATPGFPYKMTGWAGAGASYIGLTDPTVSTEFHLQFLNSSNAVIADNALNLVVNGQHVLGSPDGNPFGYFNYTLTGTAPAGTTAVRVLADMANAYGNPAGGDQAFVVDAFTLSVPEHASLPLI